MRVQRPSHGGPHEKISAGGLQSKIAQPIVCDAARFLVPAERRARAVAVARHQLLDRIDRERQRQRAQRVVERRDPRARVARADVVGAARGRGRAGAR